MNVFFLCTAKTFPYLYILVFKWPIYPGPDQDLAIKAESGSLIMGCVQQILKSGQHFDVWARICKRLGSPGIDSKELIPPAYVTWRAGMSNTVVVPARQAENRFLGLLKRFTNTGSDMMHNTECRKDVTI